MLFFGFLKKLGKYPDVERRREERYPAEDEFVVEFQGGSSYIGSSRDISVHGVRFATTCKLKQGSKIVLNFRMPQEFPGAKRFAVKAKVARIYKPRGTERYRAGCSLIHEEEKTREAIRQFVYWLEHPKGKHD